MLTLKNLGRVVSSDWEEIIIVAKKRLRWVTIIGMILLAVGFILQIIGNLM